MASINLQGDTSGSISISAPSVAGSNTLTLPATTQTLATENALGVRNLIINGDMRIAQRGTSTTGITGSGFHTIDRFYTTLSSLGTWTHTQSTDVPTGQGFASSYKIDCTTADASPSASDYKIWSHKIEAQMLQHLKFGTSSAEKLTVSFWVKSNKTATYILEFQQPDANRISSNAFTINSADTWEKKTITIDGDTSGTINNDNGSGLELNFWFGAGTTFTSGTLSSTWASKVSANRCVGISNLADSTSNYINITGVQLEVGDTATPFEHRPYDMELARCQRYFIKSYNHSVDVGTNTFGGAYSGRNYSDVTRGQNPVNVRFPVTMRGNPTMTAYSKDGTSGKATTGSTSIDAGSTNVNCTLVAMDAGIRNATVSIAAGNYFQVHYTASAEL